MHVTWLDLADFRSYRRLTWRPDPGINVLVGPNGAGKTTVLEAIGYLSALRSFRGTPDAALIRTGSASAVARGGFATEAGETTIEVELPGSGRRRVLVNGKRPMRLSTVAVTAPVVAFLPDDLDLVKESAGVRRRYLDDLGSQLSPGYGATVSEYESVLRQRNALLRRDGPLTDDLALEVWDARLVETATLLWAERAELTSRLKPFLTAAHHAVSGGYDRLGAALRPAWGVDGEELAMLVFDPDEAAARLSAALGARRRRELEQRTTTVGPHRDDVTLTLDERDLRTQASQGEQRLAAVALRVAAYYILADRHGHPPVLLLDDVFSELDLSRTAAVVEMLPRGQVLVTTTREDEVPVEGRRWEVSEGTVR